MAKNGKLSQEEIDTLLRGAKPEVKEPGYDLTEEQRDAIGEIGNISFGTAATTLSSLLGQRVDITTPKVDVLQMEQVASDFPRPYVVVTVEYTSGLTGVNALAIQMNDAKTIADLMMGGDGTQVAEELNDLHLSAVSEAMNQMMGGAATALSDMFQRPIHISPPTVRFVDLSSGERPDLGSEDWIVNTAFRLRVGQLIDSSIMQWTPVHFATDLLALAGAAYDAQTGHQRQGTTPELPYHSPHRNETTSAHADEREEKAIPVTRQDTSGTPDINIQRPEFQELTQPARTVNPRNLSLLYDVNLNITVELGRTKRPIREILELTPGSIVGLDKLAGEPVDILVNHKLIATGEVVVIDENFGVRITDIISPEERVRSFQAE